MFIDRRVKKNNHIWFIIWLHLHLAVILYTVIIKEYKVQIISINDRHMFRLTRSTNMINSGYEGQLCLLMETSCFWLFDTK